MPQSVKAFALNVQLFENMLERALIGANLHPIFTFCRYNKPTARLLFKLFQLSDKLLWQRNYPFRSPV